MNLPKIATLRTRLSRTVDHWEVHPPDRRAYLYLYLSSLCERTQSRFEIRGRASSSREVVRRERLTSSGSRDRRFAYALPAEGSWPKDPDRRTRVREILFPLAALPLEIIPQPRPSRNRYATVRSLMIAFFFMSIFGKVNKIFSMIISWILRINLRYSENVINTLWAILYLI